MAFIDPASSGDGVLIGPAQGAHTLFRSRESYPAGFFVGLHTHEGDESFQVVRGEVRFTVGGERKICRAGEIVFAPPGVEHGLLALTDATVDIISQQRMGLFVIVLEPDGRRRVEEIFIAGFFSSREPPPGEDHTPPERIRALYGTTRHLL